jgi:cytokinin dehydrogenase
MIDMSFLHRIRSIDAASAWVDGRVRWIDLLRQTLTRSLTPPVFTDFIELSIGGTLSVWRHRWTDLPLGHSDR